MSRERPRDKREKKAWIFVISGPSGSGKTTLREELLKAGGLKRGLIKSISFTTRPRRTGERNGRDYLFITKEQFKTKLRAEKILEWTRYLGYYYGTPKDFIDAQLKRGKSVVVCLDFRGAAALKRLYPRNTVTIFVKPPTLGTLRSRIERRCTHTKKEEIHQRLSLARRELLHASRYDYRLVNKDLKQVIGRLKQIILKRYVLAKIPR